MGIESRALVTRRGRSCDRTAQEDGTGAAQNIDIKRLIRPKGQAIAGKHYHIDSIIDVIIVLCYQAAIDDATT
jgi:hypothetical protein